MRKLLVSLVLILGLAGDALAQEEARAVIERAVKAHGGEEKLAKTRAVQEKAKGTLYVNDMKIEFTAESTIRLPGQFKNVIQSEIQGTKVTLIQVLNGDKGWLSINGKTDLADDKTLVGWKELIHAGQVATLVPLLKDNAYQLTLLGESKVNDRPALGVRVAAKGRKEVRLYFDKTSGLLVKRAYETLDSATMKEVTHEEVSVGFQEIDGVKRPLEVVVYQNGKKYLEGKLVEIKFLDKLDDSVFGRP